MNFAVVSQLSTEEARASAAHELFRPMGVDGVYARTGLYEQVVDSLANFITLHREPNTQVLRFPPVMSRRILELSGYLGSFPHLLGCVSCLEGSEAEIYSVTDRRDDEKNWTDMLAPADLVLNPASCYPVYPLAAQGGTVGTDGLLFDVAADCFRREPSRDIDRMQSFRMREYVCIGTPEQAADFRMRWMKRVSAIADQLNLAHRIAPASDPFFGRAGALPAKRQVKQSLKFEVLVPVRSADSPTACMSLNNHLDHFGSVWGLRNAAGDISHTSCVAFGMDRIAVAMFVTHGVNLANWPTSVLTALRL